MPYQLMKKAFQLKRVDREYLYDNFDVIAGILKEKEQKRIDNFHKTLKRLLNQEDDTKQDPDKGYIPKTYDHLKNGPDRYDNTLAEHKAIIKQAGQSFDPETVEEMIKLIDLMEKFIKIDGDFAYDNICVFIYPLTRGARKIILRPYKIVGLAKIIEQLSRKYKELKNSPRSKTLMSKIERDFIRKLNEIKRRLTGGEKTFPIPPMAKKTEHPIKLRFKSAGIDGNTDILRRALNNIKLMNPNIDMETAKQQVQLIAGDLSYDALSILDAIALEVFS